MKPTLLLRSNPRSLPGPNGVVWRSLRRSQRGWKRVVEVGALQGCFSGVSVLNRVPVIARRQRARSKISRLFSRFAVSGLCAKRSSSPSKNCCIDLASACGVFGDSVPDLVGDVADCYLDGHDCIVPAVPAFCIIPSCDGRSWSLQ